MQVGTGGITGGTYLCNHLAFCHLFPHAHQQLGAVHVDRAHPASVVNHNIIARDYFKLLAKDKSVMSEAALELHNFMLTVLKMKLAEKLRLNDE